MNENLRKIFFRKQAIDGMNLRRRLDIPSSYILAQLQLSSSCYDHHFRGLKNVVNSEIGFHLLLVYLWKPGVQLMLNELCQELRFMDVINYFLVAVSPGVKSVGCEPCFICTATILQHISEKFQISWFCTDSAVCNRPKRRVMPNRVSTSFGK